MAHQRTGFNADTFKRLVVGPGAVYLDYDLVTERLLGATRGGNVFEPGVTLRDVEVDGVKGKIKGGRIIDRVEPVLRCNLIEFSVENLLAAIPGLVDEAVVGSAQGEEWELDVGSASGGTFTLYRGTNGTAALAYNAAASLVEYELERLYGVGNVDVTKAGAVYTIAFPIAMRGGLGLTANLASLTYPGDPDATLTKTETYDQGDSYTKLTLEEITSGAYFTNCALVGRVSGTNQPVVVILKNVLGGGGFSMSFAANGEMVSELRLEGHFEPPGEGEYDPEFPFEIHWPPEA